MVYRIIAYPHGKREVVATLHGTAAHYESYLRFMMPGDNTGSEAEAIVAHAHVQAAMRGEYVDVQRGWTTIATVGPEGVVA